MSPRQREERRAFCADQIEAGAASDWFIRWALLEALDRLAVVEEKLAETTAELQKLKGT